MLIAIALLVAIFVVLNFEKPLKKNPLPFYVVSAGLSLAVVAVERLGVTFSGFFGTYIYPLFSKGILGLAFFILVMYAVTFKNGSRAIKLLMSLRGEMSIIASFLCLGHVITRGITYFSKLFTAPEKMRPAVLFATVASVLIVLILLPLFITSFKRIRRKMSGTAWKKLQRLAYAFYALVYLHILLFSLSAALRGSLEKQIDLVIYSAIFLWYLICRLLKAHATKNKSFNLNFARSISLAFVVAFSLVLFFGVRIIGKKPVIDSLSDTASTDTAVEATVEATVEAAAETTVSDGTYTATAFGYEGNITVEIVVKEGAVTSVRFSEYEDDEEYKAYSDSLLEAISKNPLGDFDAVSGATFSTGGVLKAYEEALNKAGIEKH